MVPKRLKEAREAAGLSQEKLSELVGVEGVNPRSRMSNYEAGRFAPPFEFVCRVADVLGYPEYYFYIVNDVTAKLLLRMHRGEQNLHEDIEFEAKKMAEQLEDARKLVTQLTECLKHRP
ncbi:helix-turn-helix transcriptional regulator [Salmonella enterica]|uniref:helix-turn-helix domain-containing protein n=1 Tax=Escherichia coli TaxID=562 RepID=UPI000750A578|nr:helix-turn-helix transcriptional regulator [Escherichia coli]EFS0483902.1 helix-turn-helix transcriptional regulator [Salmonella enterica]ELE3269935.1 helix-turn-helix transcriptional regulator [Salmonella enterica subsp. enterica serovar Muenchen]EHT8728092.1 helix-turn-helix transcriptional regulator [Salmonella enterica]EHY4405013.1 helix-turn-helix transcriptional regulator [Salmonella enterica]EIV4520414.1 helix-turn-helix transcriptional regulator [Salmonella enterica]